MKLSLIIPCYNEQDNVRAFYDAAAAAFAQKPWSYELLFVDDGSTDATLQALEALYEKDPAAVRVISFSRNFGKEAAFYAGLKAAKGDFVGLIDADLQQRPEVMAEMLELLLAGPEYDCVAACQRERKEGGLLRGLKKGFYRVIDRMADVRFQENASDFRVFRREMADAILQLGEYHRFSKGIFAWVGFRTKFIGYDVAPRVAGRTKWSVKKLFQYAFEGILSFSTAPLHAATMLGMLSALAAFVYLAVVIIQKLTCGIGVPGYATIVVLLLFLGGLQLMGLGIIGEYVGKIYEQSKNRPVYLTRRTLGLKEKNDAEAETPNGEAV